MHRFVLLLGLLLPLSFTAQDTLTVQWAGTLSGSEVASVDVTAGCALSAFDISLDIVAPGSNWAGDMALAITAPTATESRSVATTPASDTWMPEAGLRGGTTTQTATSPRA